MDPLPASPRTVAPAPLRLLALAALLLLLLLGAGTASARAAPRVAAQVPPQAQHGQSLVLGGAVRGLSAKKRSRARVALEQRTSRRWRVLTWAKIGRKGAFTLRWTVPARGSAVTLRISVTRKGRRLTSTRRVRMLVQDPAPAAPAPAPAGTPRPADVGDGEFGLLPIDPDAVDAFNLPAGLGGAGFSTRVPFANGARIRVTQGQNGGYSHGNAYTRNAIDLAIGAGTPVLAGFSGIVAAAVGGCAPSSWGCNGGFGNFVYLKHADGTCALHGHLSAINVAAGQTVSRYTQLGAVGSTGSSTGPHLHYDRVDCRSRGSLPWAFEDAGQPREGAVIASGNEPAPPVAAPPAPSPAPAPAPSAPRRVITVDNRVTNGMGMREDGTPARLTTKPWVRCGSRGCNINGTERSSGGQYDAAVCTTTGERTTNGHDTDPADDGNPERFESSRYYGVRLGDGTFGFVSEVWIRASDRGGLGLPAC